MLPSVPRWNRYILDDHLKSGPTIHSTKQTRSGKNSSEFIFEDALHASEFTYTINPPPNHRFEVVLEPSSYTTEKYELYKKYQFTTHNDTKNTPSGFKRFLVDSPLVHETIPYKDARPTCLPADYGSYHQLYRLDGKLIAMAVLDILPTCVSSVYFMYDKDYETYSLGKLSVLREASLAREIHEAGVESVDSLYMGFYIHSCPKMRYKGDYSPSYLADPETYEWTPLDKCRTSLDLFRYACFSNPSHSSNEIITDEPERFHAPLNSEDEEAINMLFSRGDKYFALSLNASPYWQNSKTQENMLPCVNGLGTDLSKKIYFRI